MNAQTLKVCLLSSDFLPNIGGIAAHVHGLATGLARIGHEVDVVVPNWRWPLQRLSPSRESSHEYGVFRVGVPRFPRVGRYYYAPWVARAIRAAYGGGVPDVLHWHTPLADGEVAARVPAAARVFTNHTSQFLEWERDQQERALARRVLCHADAVISPSRELTEATRTTGFDCAWTWTVSNGVDAERFSPELDGTAVRAGLGIGPDEVVVLCPRRLEKKNGVIHWLRALPEVLARVGGSKRVRFLLVGDYPVKDRYSDQENVVRTMAELELASQLLWVKRVPNHQMPHYFAASDIAVLPSLMEATSIAGLEAMASGVPIVATRVGGIPEIVRHGETGLLVEPASPTELAAALSELVVDAERRQSYGARARALVEASYTWEAIARETAAIYQQAVRRRSELTGVQ